MPNFDLFEGQESDDELFNSQLKEESNKYMQTSFVVSFYYHFFMINDSFEEAQHLRTIDWELIFQRS